MFTLVGQGFWVAFLQAVSFYYAAGAAIHYVIPRLAPVQSIQKHARGAHDVRRDALCSLGACPHTRGAFAAPHTCKQLTW